MCDIFWHFVTNCDTLWLFETLCYSLWHFVTLSKTLTVLIVFISKAFKVFSGHSILGSCASQKITYGLINIWFIIPFFSCVTFCDFLTLYDTLLHNATLCYTMWHFVTLCVKMWHFPTPLQSRQGMHNIDCEAVFLSPFNVFSDILSFLSHVKNQQRNFSFKIPSWRSETDF